ncbi:MAG: alpha-2-macroglobulin family protein, partial [Bacteroidota bacterium]
FFRVEEYKRPRFEVSIDPVKTDYQLGDSLKVSGFAKSFAGAFLDGAKVSYRVVRNVRYPYWYWWRGPQPSSPAQELGRGELTTDAEGKFIIPFQLKADESIDPNTKPVFTYTIAVDVTDISGETHAQSQNFEAAYQSWKVSTNLPKTAFRDQLPILRINTNNFSGQKVARDYVITFWKLTPPNRVIRKRRWEQADQFLLSEQTYQQRFPNDIFRDTQWDSSRVATLNGNTDNADTLKLASLLDNQGPGRYRMVLETRDENGESLSIREEITLQDMSSKNMAQPEAFTAILEKESAQPGDFVNLKLQTALKKCWVVYELWRGEEMLSRRFVQLKRKKPNLIQIPVQEKDRGGLSINLATVALNESHIKSMRLSVPWTNKQLQLSWSTFRSKLRPGQEEQWQLKISGPQQDAVAAEMVATMYDASLDNFSAAHGFSFFPYATRYNSNHLRTGDGFGTERARQLHRQGNYQPVWQKGYDSFLWGNSGYRAYASGGGFYANGENEWAEADAVVVTGQAAPAPAGGRSGRKKKAAAEGGLFLEKAVDDDGLADDFDAAPADDKILQEITAGNVKMTPEPEPEIRTNLNETAFFLPQLQTDKAGIVILNFTMPEALTRWKFVGLAHTKDLEIGTIGGETLTQKELMVVPNLPRFFRENDQIRLSSKITNLSEETLNGSARLELLDALSMQPIGPAFGHNGEQQAFLIEKGRSAAVSWDLKVPETVQAVVVRISATTGDFSDGEEQALPVLKNRMLVTETLPLAITGKGKQTFSFDKLITQNSSTLQHQRLSLEMTSNPAWYAVQALPYLMEFPHECTEQIFSRFYANALASHIANQSPRIQQVFDQWKNQDADRDALLSNLEHNQELKSALLEETPWVLNAQSESARKKRIALLFDINRIANEQGRAYQQLKKRQNSNGAFSWFPGMRDSRYITQLVVLGMGHLQKLGVSAASGNPEINNMVASALPYLDRQIKADHDRLIREKYDLDKNHLRQLQIQYLYMRSFFPDIPLAKGTDKAYQYYYAQGEKFWLTQSKYSQGMLALTYHRTKSDKTSQKILASLEEKAIVNQELGMYWKDMSQGFYWYQAPIERHALLIEAFQEAGQNTEAVEQLKVWLLRNKQTNDWKTTRATVAAINALLSTGTDWLSDNTPVSVKVGNQTINPLQDDEIKLEAGTGYYKKSWDAAEITAEMGKISVEKASDGVAWGAMYWQYFEQLDKITSAETPLSLKKEIFKVDYTDQGPKLRQVDAFQPGDKIKVRIELRVDRAMEYVHMKDLRAAAFEPVDVLSQYRYQNGLGYYQSTRDLATHFFFDYLPKGTHVFEYTLFATQQGD